MDKKLFCSVATVLILLSVLWVFATSSTLNNCENITMLTNVTAVNWSSKLGTDYTGAIIVNITLVPNFTMARYTSNITNITIRTNPANVFNITLNPHHGIVADNDTSVYFNGTQNVTMLECGLIGDTAGNYVVQCLNSSNAGNSEIPGNATINIWFQLEQNKTTSAETYNNEWAISIHTNDSVNQDINDLERVIYFGTDDLAPRIVDINISDGTYNRQNASRDVTDTTGFLGYLLNDTNIIISLIVDEYNRDNYTLAVWGTSSNTGGFNATISEITAGPNVKPQQVVRMNTSCIDGDDRTQTCLYTASILNSHGGNLTDGTQYTLWFWVNDSFDQKQNITNGGIGYNFTIDGDTPARGTITIGNGRTTIFGSTDAIKIKCFGPDDTSPTYSTIKLTKPNRRTIEKTVYSHNDYTYEFKGAETIDAGTYKVDCTVYDQVGHHSTAPQKTFIVYFFGVGVAEEGVEVPVADVDVSTVEEPTGLIAGKQGESKTFTMDGVTTHTMEFLEVTFTSAKLRIESDPVEITLDVGKYKNVDLDGDGTDDVKVTLKAIEDDLAKVEVINLEKLAEKERGVEPEVPTVEEEGKAGLWITILVILVVILVGYFVMKKRKGKKGQVKFSKQDLGL